VCVCVCVCACVERCLLCVCACTCVRLCSTAHARHALFRSICRYSTAGYLAVPAPSLLYHAAALAPHARVCTRRVQSYANAALLSYTTELYKSRLGLLFNASSSDASSPPVLSTNASYVMCPEAVGAVSEALRRWSGAGAAAGGNASRTGASSSSSTSTAGAMVSTAGGGPSVTSSGSRSHRHAATDDEALLSRGDSPYMVLLARASQVHGLEHVAEGWDAAAGVDARGRGHHSGPSGWSARDAGWVEVGCRVASVRRLPSIDISRV
jgi:hypothetical protein